MWLVIRVRFADRTEQKIDEEWASTLCREHRANAASQVASAIPAHCTATPLAFTSDIPCLGTLGWRGRGQRSQGEVLHILLYFLRRTVFLTPPLVAVAA